MFTNIVLGATANGTFVEDVHESSTAVSSLSYTVSSGTYHVYVTSYSSGVDEFLLGEYLISYGSSKKFVISLRTADALITNVAYNGANVVTFTFSENGWFRLRIMKI